MKLLLKIVLMNPLITDTLKKPYLQLGKSILSTLPLSNPFNSCIQQQEERLLRNRIIAFHFNVNLLLKTSWIHDMDMIAYTFYLTYR